MNNRFVLQPGDVLKIEKTLIAAKAAPGSYCWADINAIAEIRAVPVGSVEFVRAYARQHGVAMPPPLSYPEPLRQYLCRAIRLSTFSDALPDEFVKPVETKAFTGAIKSKVLEQVNPDTPVWVSDAIQFDQEFRIYVINGAVAGHSRYDDGDDDDAPWPQSLVDSIIHDFQGAPAGYCIDIGRAQNKWVLVEINDGWALGYYRWGTMTIESYMDLIVRRWLQIRS